MDSAEGGRREGGRGLESEPDSEVDWAGRWGQGAGQPGRRVLLLVSSLRSRDFRDRPRQPDEVQNLQGDSKSFRDLCRVRRQSMFGRHRSEIRIWEGGRLGFRGTCSRAKTCADGRRRR
eukprot:2730506-Rhodomonas_salina.2